VAKKERPYLYRTFFKPDQLADAFKHWQRGPDAGGRGLGYAQAWHRANTAASPYCVANEFISGRIGNMLGLPIPPFAITHGADARIFFSSLDFNFNRERLPPVVPEQCVENLPELSAGVLVFDILVANEDRRDENLLVDKVSKPAEMIVFDHDQAIFGGCVLKGVGRLRKLRDELGVTGKKPMQGCRQIFLDLIDRAELLDPWIERVSQIPEWFIDDTCTIAATELGVTDEERLESREFLLHRRNNLEQIVRNNRAEFSAIKNWPKELY
jgi:HipA-like kinase